METSGQLHTLAALSPGKEPPVPIKQETVWATELVWTPWNRASPCEESNHDSSDVQPAPYHFSDYATHPHTTD